MPGPKDGSVLYDVDEVAADLPGFRIESTLTADHDLGDGRVSTDAILVARRP